MKFKKTTALLLLLIVALSSVVSACSASQKMSIPLEDKDYGSAYPSVDRLPQDMDSDLSGTDVISPADPDLPRKLIQNAEMTLKSKDPVKTQSDIQKLAGDLGGRVAEFEQARDQTTSIQLTVEVPADQLENFLMQVNNSDGVEVKKQSLTSEDVTDSFYDTETRLRSTRELIDHYRSLLKDAKDIEETLLVQERIDQLTVELEVLEARLQRLDRLSADSRIYIYIYQETDPLSLEPNQLEPLSWEHIKYFILNSLSKLSTILVLIGQYLFIALVVGSPIIVPVVLIILIIYFAHKRKKKRRLKDTQITTSPDNERIEMKE